MHIEGHGAVAGDVVALVVGVVVIQVRVVHRARIARAGVEAVLVECEQHVAVAVELVGRGIDAADVAVVIVPVGDVGQVGRHRAAGGLGGRRIGQVDVRLGALREADAHGDELCGACRKGDVLRDEAVGGSLAVGDHEGLVGVAEEVRPPLIAVCRRGVEDVPPCLFGSVVVVRIVGIEEAGIHILGLDVGDAAVGYDGHAAAEGAREGSGKGGTRFDVLAGGRRNVVKAARVLRSARQGDLHRTVARRRIAVFRAGQGLGLEVGEGRIAVREVIAVGRDDARGTVGKFDVEGLVLVRLVGEEEEALHPTVVDILIVVVDIDGVHGVGVERGERGAVLAVHERRIRARQAFGDLARLDEEGDQHPLARSEGDVARLGGVGRAVCGHQHEDVAVLTEGVLAFEVVAVDLLQGGVGGCRDLRHRHEGGHVLLAVAERGVDALGRVRLAARDFARERKGHIVQKVARRVEAGIQVEGEGVARHAVRIKDLLFGKGIDGADVPIGGDGLLVSLGGDDLAGDVVEEGIAVDVLVAVGRGAAAEAEHHREGGGSEGAGAHIDGVLLPFAFGVDVLDLHLVERRAAHRVGDADVGTAAAGDLRLAVCVVMREGIGAHPDGELGCRARLERDRRARGIVLCGTEDVLARPPVVDHEDARVAVLTLGGVVVEGKARAHVAVEVFHVLEVDGIAVFGEELRLFGIVVEVVDLVLVEVEELEAVVGGDVVVLPMRRGFLDGGKGGHFLVVLGVGREGIAARGGEVRPVGGVDDAGGRIRRGGTGAERPVVGRVHDAVTVDDVLDVLVGVKFKIAVAEKLGIGLRDGGVLVVRGIRPVRAGGKDPQGERRRDREREHGQNVFSPGFRSIVFCHKTPFFSLS